MEAAVIICGGRNPPRAVQAAVSSYVRRLERVVVVTGAARGVDRIAENAARARGLRVITYPAKWGKFGAAAGPIRNAQMLEDVLLRGWDVRVVAFPGGRGTADMVARAEQRGVRVERP